jgi:hypothetical protein
MQAKLLNKTNGGEVLPKRKTFSKMLMRNSTHEKELQETLAKLNRQSEKSRRACEFKIFEFDLNAKKKAYERLKEEYSEKRQKQREYIQSFAEIDKKESKKHGQSYFSRFDNSSGFYTNSRVKSFLLLVEKEYAKSNVYKDNNLPSLKVEETKKSINAGPKLKANINEKFPNTGGEFLKPIEDVAQSNKSNSRQSASNIKENPCLSSFYTLTVPTQTKLYVESETIIKKQVITKDLLLRKHSGNPSRATSVAVQLPKLKPNETESNTDKNEERPETSSRIVYKMTARSFLTTSELATNDNATIVSESAVKSSVLLRPSTHRLTSTPLAVDDNRMVKSRTSNLMNVQKRALSDKRFLDLVSILHNTSST